MNDWNDEMSLVREVMETRFDLMSLVEALLKEKTKKVHELMDEVELLEYIILHPELMAEIEELLERRI